MVVGSSLEIIVEAKLCGTISPAVNLDNMVEIIHSCNMNPEQNLHRQITQTRI